MIGAIDEQHVGITQRLRGRQASETTPDDDDLFVRHEREPQHRLRFRETYASRGVSNTSTSKMRLPAPAKPVLLSFHFLLVGSI